MPMTLKLGMQHQVSSNDDWVDIDLFYGKVKFGPLCFCMEKIGKTMDFSETIVVYDVIVGRYSYLMST